MTRETKIGLLVGLAFIIVVGILLSEHYASAMRPPDAVLMGTAENVREGAATPGTRREYSPPRIEGVEPRQPVETDPIRRPQGNVRVRPPAGEGTRIDGREHARNPGAVEPNNGQSGDGGISIEPVQPDEREARRPENELPMQPQRQHKAESGDTIYRMAIKYYGSASQQNMQMIFDANPSLGGKATRVQVGHLYVIPPKAGETPANPVRIPPTENGAVVNRPPATSPDITSVAATTYTAKQGDSLWRIASEQCGSASLATVAKIRELNADVLRGDLVKPGMVLKLPPKAVATAN